MREQADSVRSELRHARSTGPRAAGARRSGRLARGSGVGGWVRSSGMRTWS